MLVIYGFELGNIVNLQGYDEEEDEDNDGGRYNKRRRNERHGGFILDEAEVDDEVESEDDWEEGAQEIGIISHEIEEHGPTAREIEGRRRGTSLWEWVSVQRLMESSWLEWHRNYNQRMF